MTTASVTSGHYERHTTDTYESAYFYSPGEYTDWLRDRVREALNVGSSDSTATPTPSATTTPRRLIDIGGGTGNFTSMILDGVPNVEAVIVDPFLEASNDVDAGSGSGRDGAIRKIRFVKAGAEDYAAPAADTNTTGSTAASNTISTDSPLGGEGDDDETTWWKRNYHQVLMKEVVHHLAANDRIDIFRGLRMGLVARSSDDTNTAASILIVTRPQVDIDYPLWPEARAVWAANQPSAPDIKADLASAGFCDVESTVQTYPAQIQLNRWLDMVRGRFWSTFSSFGDAELEEACELIQKEAKTDADGVAHFEDRLVFITAK